MGFVNEPEIMVDVPTEIFSMSSKRNSVRPFSATNVTSYLQSAT